ncbi:MAG: endonuclease [Polaromonas sp.]|nr:endonuclease [Polaromonas sp.]
MVSKRALRGTEPLGYVKPPGIELCPLCGRPLETGASVDEHHLVPRSQGGSAKVLMHRICHRKIHATFSERELARSYHTWEALKTHPEIVAFVRWVAGKPPAFYDNSRRPARRR